MSPPPVKAIDRRSLVKGAGAAALLGGLSPLLTACARRDSIIDRVLPRPNGSVQGYRGLAQLPYFELTPKGVVGLKPALREKLPEAIDFHAHLGMSFMFAPAIDYNDASKPMQYLMGCDETNPPCTVHLDDYLNKIADENMLHEMESRILRSGLDGGTATPTHTIPNLLAEMDALKVSHAVLLAVQPPMPFRSDPTDAWLTGVEKSGAAERFAVFGAVRPGDSSVGGKLERYHRIGLRGIKIHPPMQQFRPDEKRALEIYEICDRLGLIVFLHCGRAGIEPKYSQPFAHIQGYEVAARAFPRVRFVWGHAGARDWEAAAEAARRCDNVTLEVEGQGVAELRHILRRVGPEKMMYGSDWPFYPLAATTARVLLATEGDPAARDRILAHNARALLRLG